MNKAKQKHYLKIISSITVLSTALILSACGGSSSSSSPEIENDSGIYFDISTVNYSAVTVDETGLPSGARVLASQCAVCHGTYGVAVRDWPDLWGSNRRISGWMNDYQDPALYADNLMHVHALAYTVDEVDLLKSYYQAVTYTGGE